VNDLHARLRANLEGRYAIERELGRGGMATVFLSRDLRHDRPVALKVLHPELGVSLGAERFLREIRLCARLQHPHILTVHDSGEVPATAGEPPLLWFTMPFIEGESLRDRLRRQRQLPVDEAVRITREAADALNYAHRHGVVHRDIKPENILLSEGHALVADFGIGRAIGAASPGEKLTETGMVVGTPAYMSPEQASGERELDGRTDVYALGAVLYEMLAGEPPYTGATAQQIIVKRFTDPVPSVRSVRPSVPEAVDQAIRKALAPIAADRFASGAEFARALETAFATSTRASPPAPPPATPSAVLRPAATATAVAAGEPVPRRAFGRRYAVTLALLVGFAIGLGVLFAWRSSHGGGEANPGARKAIAVLPFENLGAADDEYFSDGITDEIRGKLASLPGLQVTARSSSREYKKSSKRPQEIGRELGVDYLLTGTVRWENVGAEKRARVSPELIDVRTGSATWQQPFDARLTEVFQVQADIAGRVAAALNLALGAPQKETLAERPTANLAAYEIYLRAEAVSPGLDVVPSLQQAIGLYEQAIALDSTFLEAWAQLSRAHSRLYFIGTPTASGAEAARRAAEQAVALGPTRPEGQLALGDYRSAVRGDNRQAIAAYDAGLRLAPDNADLLSGSALAEQSLGRWDAALAHLERARKLDPRSVQTARRHLLTLIWLRRYPEAEAAADRALALAPDNLSIIEYAAQVRLGQGDLEGARTAVRAAMPSVDLTALVAFFGTFWDLYWVLDDAQQQLLLRLAPSAFGDDRGNWAIVRAQAHHLRGNIAAARIYGDSARVVFEEQLRGAPDDPQRHVFLGLALAYLGRKAEAIREGENGVALRPINVDGYTGPYLRHLLARIYLLVGEPEKALDQLEPLLKIPYYLSPGWLRIDPTWDPLRKHPRFQKLVEAGATS
jgi:serine/threonine-protein kinase